MGIKECLVYLTMMTDSGYTQTYTTTVMLNLDESVEDQVFSLFPDAYDFSWVECSEVA